MLSFSPLGVLDEMWGLMESFLRDSLPILRNLDKYAITVDKRISLHTKGAKQPCLHDNTSSQMTSYHRE